MVQCCSSADRLDGDSLIVKILCPASRWPIRRDEHSAFQSPCEGGAKRMTKLLVYCDVEDQAVEVRMITET